MLGSSGRFGREVGADDGEIGGGGREVDAGEEGFW